MQFILEATELASIAFEMTDLINLVYLIEHFRTGVHIGALLYLHLIFCYRQQILS